MNKHDILDEQQLGIPLARSWPVPPTRNPEEPNS